MLFVREGVCLAGEFTGRVRGLLVDEGERGCLCGLCGELPVDFLVAEGGSFGVDRILGERDTVFLDRVAFSFEGRGEGVYGVFRVAAELRGEVAPILMTLLAWSASWFAAVPPFFSWVPMSVAISLYWFRESPTASAAFCA